MSDINDFLDGNSSTGNAGEIEGFLNKPAGPVRQLADAALSLGKGIIAVPEAAVGLADMVSGGKAGKAVENAGVRFKDAKDALTEMQSPELAMRREQFQQADGVLDKIGVAVTNPSLVANTVVESLPLMGGGASVAQGAMRVGAKALAPGAMGPALPGIIARTFGHEAAPMVAGGLGEGVVGMGSAAEGIRQETPTGELSAAQTGLAGLTGLATAGFGIGGGRIAKHFGVGDPDTMLAAGSRQIAGTAGKPKGPVRRVLEGGAVEGFLEELPQSLSEQALQNIALDKPVTEGLADAGVLGTLAGNVMGGTAGAFAKPTPTTAPYAAAPTAGPITRAAQLLLGNDQTITADAQGTALTGKDRADVAAGGGGPLVETGDMGQGRNNAPAAGPVTAMIGMAGQPTGTLVAGSDGVLTPETGIDRINREQTQKQEAEKRDARNAQNAELGHPDTEVEGGDITFRGEPFKGRVAAMGAATRAGEGYQVRPVQGGFVVSKRPIANVADDVTDVEAKTPQSAATGPSIDAGAHAAASSPQNDLPEPTKAQILANNGKLGHAKVGGMGVSIENPAGSTREDKKNDPPQWRTEMQGVHYGYWKGTEAADSTPEKKQGVDGFFAEGLPEDYDGPVFVIDQVDPKTGKFDEHKTVVGPQSEAEALAMYQRHYQAGWKGAGAITQLPMAEFKKWVTNGPKKEALGVIAAQGAAPLSAPAAAAKEIPAQPAGSGVPVDAGANQQPDAALSAPERYGVGGTPVSQGGKPFKSKLGAIQYQKKHHPQSRIVKAKGGKGFVLVDRTDKELAAQQANAKKMASANRAKAYEKNPFLEWLGGHGLFHVKGDKRSLKAEYSPDKNPFTTSGPLFRRTGLPLDLLAARAAQDGFLPPGSDDAHALEQLVHRVLRGERVAPVYAEGGTEREFERQLAERPEPDFDDFLDAEMESPSQPDDFSLTDEDFADTGYSNLDEQGQARIRALIALAEAQGIDTEPLLDEAHAQTHNLPNEAYYDAAEEALHQALARGSEDRRADSGQQEQAPGASQAAPSEEVAAPAASPAAGAWPKLEALADRVDNDFEYSARDLWQDLPGLIDDQDAPTSLQAAVDTFQNELDDDRDMGGRGDLDTAEENLMRAVRAALTPEAAAPTEAAPKVKDPGKNTFNENDVAIGTPAERMVLTKDAKSGTVLAEVEVFHMTDGTWAARMAYRLPEQGASGPAMRQDAVATRDEAVNNAIAGRHEYLAKIAVSDRSSNSDKKAAQRVLHWLEGIWPGMKEARAKTEAAPKLTTTSGKPNAMAVAKAKRDAKPKPAAAPEKVKKPAAAPVASPVSAPAPVEPPATEVAKPTQSPEELRAKADLGNALADLGDILSKPGRMNITPEQEAKLLPVLTRVFDAAFRLGFVKFKQAAKYVLDQIRAALGNDVADAISIDHLQGAYIAMAGKYKAQGADTAKAVVAVESKDEIDAIETPAEKADTEDNHVPGPDISVERDSGQPAAQPGVGNAVPNEPGPAGQRPGDAGQGSGVAGSGQQNDPGLPASGPAAFGERGDQRFPGGKQPAGPAGGPSGDLFGERGPDTGISGSAPDAIPAGSVKAASAAGDELGRRRDQRAADSVAVKPGDLANIRESLPYLLEGQQEDVHKAETRYAKPTGYGLVLTNGTGTGKTFSGLGTIKRFERQGKKNVLIVVPDEKIGDDWIESGKPMQLAITRLADTKTAGEGIVITTYANLGANDELAKRDWDLVVTDEAHMLMQAADGEPTLFLQRLRAITHHPDGNITRHSMLHRELIDTLSALEKEIRADGKEYSAPDTTDMRRAELKKRIDANEAKALPLRTRVRETREAVDAEVAAKQGAPRARMLALTATPFAYEKTIDWGNGYLFDYKEGYPYEGNSGYNTPSPREYFFITHLGYRMRYGKLTEPDSKVDRGLMQRQFNGWLKKQGVLSGRMLDVPADYDRRFILVDSAVGNQIDAALDWLSDKSYGGEKIEGMSAVRDMVDDQFDYLSRRYLLEAIKAQEVVPIVRQHLKMGRKVVVFHDYNKGGGFNPFDVQPVAVPQAGTDPQLIAKAEAVNKAVGIFRAQFTDLIETGFDAMNSPIDTFRGAFGDELLLINGLENKREVLRRYTRFQDDGSGPLVALVQADKNKGWSGHDTTGKTQRVLINLGQPTQPTRSIQQEGRIYRTGQVSDAIFRYMSTGTNWEKWAFATTIANRSGTAENLGMGELARALKDAFIAAYEEADAYPPGHEGEGTGGKERDKAANNALSEYDRAKAFYFGTQKKNSRTKAQEGKDYFATPEPVGLKMAQWAGVRGGEDVLEPSAGHGAIARWFPEPANRTAVEPSSALRSRLAMVFDGKIIEGTFEDHNVVNKYDGIVMNPPFGVGGKTAIDHLEKAATHLRDGGRIVALIPRGPMADKRLEKFLYETEAKPLGTTSRTGDYYAGDVVTIDGARPGEQFVVRRMDAHGLVLGVGANGTGGEVTVRSHYLESIVTPGPRTVASDLQLIADIVLPTVTFERAGTSVASHIIVLQKGKDTPQQINRDYSDVDDINALFDRLENLDLAERAEKPVASGPAPTAAPARPAAATPSLPPVAVGDMVEVTTKAGKVLRGVLRPDLTLEQAKAIDPYTWQPKGMKGWFIREKYLQGGNVAKEERAVYEVREPQANYDIDLFPATLDGLQDDKAIPKVRKPAAVPERPAPTAVASPVLALRESASTPGVYHVSTQLVQVGTRMLPTDRVIDWDGAADALSGLSRFAVEHFDMLITDADGKPMAIVGGFKGTLSQTSIYPNTLAMEALRIKGAAHAWAVHNHPGGEPRLSDADRRLSMTLDHLFFPATLEYHGIAAVARQADGSVKWSAMDADERDYKGQFTPGPATFPVPVVEREIITSDKVGATLTSPSQARTILNQVSAGAPGLLLLNAQSAVTGWIPMRSLSEQKGKAYDELVNALAGASTASVVVANPGGIFTTASVQDLKARLSMLDIRVMDSIDPTGGGKSMAEQGVLEPDDLLSGYDKQAAIEKQQREEAARNKEEAERNAKAEKSDAQKKQERLKAEQVDLFNPQSSLFRKDDNASQAAADTAARQSRGIGMTRTAFAQAMADAFGPEVAARLEQNGVVIPLADQSELPSHVVPFVRDDDIVYGFYDPRTDRTYAVLSNLTPAMVKGLAIHEVGVHYGFEAMLGKKKYDQVINRIKALGRLRHPQVLAAREAAQKNSAHVGQIPEETLAYLVQNNPDMGLVREIIAKIKAFLFDKFGILGDSLTVNDIAALAHAAVLHSSRTQPGARRPAFADSGKDSALSREAAAPETMFSRTASVSDLTPEQERALRNVGGMPTRETLRERVRGLKANLGTKLRTGLVDQFAPMLKLSQKAYMMARMSKGGDGTMEAVMLYGKPVLRDGVPDVNIADGGFAAVLATLKGEHDRFLWWVAAQRAERLKAEGRENLFGDADIADLKTLNTGNFADGTARAAVYQAAALKLAEFNESVLKLALDSGLITQDAFDVMKGQPYVPFYRIMEGGDTPQFSARGGLVNQSAYKQLKGGTAKLNNDLLQNMLLNWSHLFTATARNRAALVAIDDAVNMAIAYPAPYGAKDAVTIKRNGLSESYIIEDPFLMEAVSALHYVPSELLKPLAAMKHVLTLGVTANPAFKIRNLIRDSLSAIGTSELGYNPLANIAQGWKATGKTSQVFASMLAAGGVMRFGATEDTNRVRRQIENVGGNLLDKKGWAKLTGQVAAVWDAYQELGDRGENVNRAALYQQLIAKGHSHADAAFMARDLMDFSMSGQWGAVRFLAQTVPFFNARLQGLYKLGRAAGDDPRKFAVVAGAVSMASLALMLAYGDDDDWKKREDWDRDANWWFKIGDTAFRIPKPFEIGAIGTLAERSAEFAFSDEMTGKRFSQRISAMLFQTFSFDPTPQIVKPLMDVYANKDSFTGRAIESMSDRNVKSADRISERTSEVGKLLGAIGLPDPGMLAKGEYAPLSPKQVDFLLRGYFGWMGTAAMTVSDYSIRPLTDRGARPALQLRDVFLAGNFVEGLPTGSSRYVTQMYEQAKAIEQAYGSYQAALKRGDAEAAQSIMLEEGDKIRAFRGVQHIKRAESQVNAQARRVEASKTLSSADKRSQLEALALRRDQLARQVRLPQ